VCETDRQPVAGDLASGGSDPYDEAAADLRAHHQATGSRDLEEANFPLAHLDRFFGGWRLVAIDQGAVRQYEAPPRQGFLSRPL